jgi:hypothetical protein
LCDIIHGRDTHD